MERKAESRLARRVNRATTLIIEVLQRIGPMEPDDLRDAAMIASGQVWEKAMKEAAASGLLVNRNGVIHLKGQKAKQPMSLTAMSQSIGRTQKSKFTINGRSRKNG